MIRMGLATALFLASFSAISQGYPPSDADIQKDGESVVALYAPYRSCVKDEALKMAAANATPTEIAIAAVQSCAHVLDACSGSVEGFIDVLETIDPNRARYGRNVYTRLPATMPAAMQKVALTIVVKARTK